MRPLILIVALLACASVAQAQSTFTAASCNYADVQAVINTEQVGHQDGDIISIPAGSCTWTGSQTVNQIFPNSFTIQGAGAVSSTTGGGGTTGTDQTIILNNRSAGFSNLFVIGTTAGKTFRFTGIFLTQNSSSPNTTGTISIYGGSTSVRIDHCHFHLAINGTSTSIGLFGPTQGVIDHNFFDDAQLSITNDIGIFNGANWNGHTDYNGDTVGDFSWNDGDHWGGSQFMFIEDNRFSLGGGIGDSHNGARYVFRHNTVSGQIGELYAHGVATGRQRGMRAAEVYDNNYNNTANSSSSPSNVNSGTMLFWGNTVTGGYNSAIAVGYSFRGTAGGGGNYNYPTPPGGWGFCGPGAYQTGTVNVDASGNVSLQSGSNFSTSWPHGSPIIINGLQSYDIESVSSTTALIIKQCSSGSCGQTYTGGVKTGVAYIIASGWDAGANANGYACLDQPGRGVGDLLSGDFPSPLGLGSGTCNITLNPGCTIFTGQWPRQALSPIYAWNNTYTPQFLTSAPLIGVNGGITQILDNRDYYQQYGSLAETGSNCTTSPCSITVGINQTNRAPVNGTDTCTAGVDITTGTSAPGVGWWNTANNTLYVCNPTNTWSVYYTPYTYPHPLTSGGTPQAGTPVCSPTAGGYTVISLSVSCTNPSSTPVECYTLDGTLPVTNGGSGCTNGSVLSGSVAVILTIPGVTLKVVAGGTGFGDSAPAVNTYTFLPIITTPQSFT